MQQQRQRMVTRVIRCALAALGLALFAGEEETRAEATTTCSHTDVVFYTNDTGGRLVGELKKFPSCTDYFVSVTPITNMTMNGFPNPNPVSGIHLAGANFHAMAEIRLNPWQAYANSHPTMKTWFDTGVEVRRLMTLAGYVPEKGDIWAINEVGAPASQAMGESVMRDVGTARADFREFVRGLYTGNGTPEDAMPGLVFAASPLQVATDLSAYKADLESWYADSGFWIDMARYVRFWAQEAYADVRTWGVAGATLSDRAAYLNDYFMHGSRLAATAGESTQAAHDFFAAAYTPLGNVTYRSPAPTTAAGFGSTDVDLATMLNFASTQVYALRSSMDRRLGFADRRVPTGLPLSQVIAVEDRVAEAIAGSETDPIGACGATGELCDSSVAGAQFTGLWRELGMPTPPVIVPYVEGPLGSDGWYLGDVTVTWTVTDLESPISGTTGCESTHISADTAGTTLTCSATSFGGTDSVHVTIRRDVTPPAISCEPTPSVLWPPNHRLMPVAVDVTIDDETSGPGTFELTGASSSDDGAASDIRGFDVGQPDREGFLRAERRPASERRSYVLTYVAHDAAGNEAGCAATVVVPHDQGH